MKISIVIPIFNEAENIAELLSRLALSLGSLSDYEILLVDDGSTDHSGPLIVRYCEQDNRIKLISFSRNFGHQIAISAGMKHATGDALIVMDGDLQDPPEVLPEFIAKWQEGYEVVYAIRQKRKENIFKRILYRIFYRVLSKLSPFHIPLDSGDFGIVDRKIYSILNAFPERNKFIRGLRAWTGYRQIGIAYERAARLKGTPKFTFRKLVKLAYDGLLSFSDVPLKLASWLGFLFVLVSVVSIMILIVMKLYSDRINLQGWTSTIIVILFIGGLQLLLLGIFGEYISRIFDEVKQRPEFIVSKKVNLE
ncbi:MAG: glycosyltransferase family 2 protein [Nitrospira sp.]|nr:glycosyltransferase family 2 protein [Nitrospira sp.]